jgi:hypothetical protein
MHLITLSRTLLDKGSAYHRELENKSKQIISDKNNNVFSTNKHYYHTLMTHTLTQKGRGDQLFQLLNIMGQIIIIIIMTLLP